MQPDKSSHHSIALTDKLKPVFQNYPELVFVYLFGSLADGTADTASDIDLAVFVDYPADFSFTRKLQLHGDCCRALKRNDVDLLVLNQTRNLLLVEEVLRKGKVILNRDQRVLDDFFLKKLHLAIDFRFQRKMMIGV